MLKKISIITAATLAGLALLLCITLVSGLFYIESRPGTERLQKTINDRIPGSLTWKTLTLSPARGILEITGASTCFCRKTTRWQTSNALLLSLDLSALLNRELVIKEFAIENPTVTIEKNSANILNILAALTDAPAFIHKGPTGTGRLPSGAAV